MKLIPFALFCAFTAVVWGQNTPITLEVQSSTRYYTDGSSKTSSKMLWSTEGVDPQGIGFLGKRIRPYLAEVPEVQKKFGTFRALNLASTVSGVAALATLPMALNRQEEFPDLKWYSQFRAPILFGVGTYAAGIAAGVVFNKAIDAHNHLVGGGSDEGFGWAPQVRASTEAAGLALVWAW